MSMGIEQAKSEPERFMEPCSKLLTWLLTIPADAMRALRDRLKFPWSGRSWWDWFLVTRAVRHAQGLTVPDEEKAPEPPETGDGCAEGPFTLPRPETEPHLRIFRGPDEPCGDGE
jgi:hypothetical protein